MKCFTAIAAALLSLTACSTSSRIQEHAAEFARLPPATQENIRHGLVTPGYSPDMVYMTLGKPDEVAADPSGVSVWTYHQYPVTAYNETIQAGYLRRVVYDPAKRTSDVIVEPIDEKAFPNLVPHELRITFRDNQVVSIERFRTR